MKLRMLTILVCAASLLAQEPVASSCGDSFNAVKGIPRDAAADRIYAFIEAKIDKPEASKACEFAVELLKVQLENIALQKSLDSINQINIAVQKEISLVKDSIVALWAGDAQFMQSLNAALLREQARLKGLSQKQQENIDEKQKALAEIDSMLSIQKAEAGKKLEALSSKDMSVYRDARGTILSMSDILFETGKANLKPELKENLAEIAAILKKLLTESNVVIEGHTDDVGSAKTNQKLSESRAVAVLNYLVERGVEKKRLQSVGYGLTKPMADNKTAEGRAKNRRVELIIKDFFFLNYP